MTSQTPLQLVQEIKKDIEECKDCLIDKDTPVPICNYHQAKLSAYLTAFKNELDFLETFNKSYQGFNRLDERIANLKSAIKEGEGK